MLERFSRAHARGASKQSTRPSLTSFVMRSHAEYLDHVAEHRQRIAAEASFEESLVPDDRRAFTYDGYCIACGGPVAFRVDMTGSSEHGGVVLPNWRETLVCPGCGLNNRMRAAIDILVREYQLQRASRIYITEQMTSLYTWFDRTLPHVRGSEYMAEAGRHRRFGLKWIRNEDVTNLSFGDDKFDFILSFDVLEHVPDYRRAIAEFRRCLKPDGTLFFSVPFVMASPRNIVRAFTDGTGGVVHVLPPEYHGDPMSPDGCLCFHHFGWEILDELNGLGLTDARALLYWSSELGYLGAGQVLLVAAKPHEA